MCQKCGHYVLNNSSYESEIEYQDSPKLEAELVLRLMRSKLLMIRSFMLESKRKQKLTHEDKVSLFNIRRYLMPLPPLGTKNWTVDDFIRYIDQYGRWCPDGQDKCELPEQGSLRDTTTSIGWGQQVDPEYCPYCGSEIFSLESTCSRCGYCALCG